MCLLNPAANAFAFLYFQWYKGSGYKGWWSSLGLPQIIVLAVLEGITSILPVGTAGHVALLSPSPLARSRSEVVLAVQLGTLLAITPISPRICGTWSARGAGGERQARPWRSACRPTHRGVDSAIGLGIAAQRYDQPEFHTLTVVTWTTIGYGLLLLLFDRMSMTVKRIEHATYLDAALVGISQVLALIPGTSRAGIGMTLGRFLAMSVRRPHGFRCCCNPVLIAAFGTGTFRVVENGTITITNGDVVAFIASFVAAILSLTSLMAFLRRGTFMPFVIYRIILGVAVMTLAYGWIEF